MKYPFQMSGGEVEALATAGDREAMLLLSRWLMLGWRGLEQDDQRAIEVLQHAAALGYPRAMRMLGDRFSSGEGVIEDHQRAETWWRNAAKLGDGDAMSNLIPLIDSHDPQRSAEGRHWAQVAASEGDPYAKNVLPPDQVAAVAPPPSTELSWTVEGVRGTLQQINDLVGLWLERLRPYWPQVRVASSLDTDDIDFPCPDVGESPYVEGRENATLEVMVYSGRRHLQLDLTLGDAGWTLALLSFEPHPTQEEAPWLVGELRAVGAQLGLEI